MTKKYVINIVYTTGNTFNTYETEDTIDIVWEDLNKAKKALKAIKKHHDAMNVLSSIRYDEKEYNKHLDCFVDEEWFFTKKKISGDVKMLFFSDSYKSNIVVQRDDGTNDIIYAFWNGYFETIHKAEIILEVSEDENDMEIYF